MSQSKQPPRQNNVAQLHGPDTTESLRAEMEALMERFQALQRRIAALSRLDELESRPPVDPRPHLHVIGGAR